MMSSFCRSDAMAVKSERMEGCMTMSGWVRTDRIKACGYEANWDKMPVTSKLVEKLLVGINS